MGKPKAPIANVNGALISEEDAHTLSGRLALLGAQWQEICAELNASGYGVPSATGRAAIEALATSEEDRLRLHAYWGEWAKERLAGLVGPINILRGKYPKASAYRSELMTTLRHNAAAGTLKSCGPIVSPQIEPTIKRQVELLPDDPVAQLINDNIKKARQQAALKFSLVERADFKNLSATARYKLLIERYRAALEPDGFTLDSHRAKGLVFRKITSDRRWAVLLVDESVDGVATGSLSPGFALTLPKKAVLPNAVSLNAVATFSPDDLVPRFRNSCVFSVDSYAQFCLAADSIGFLTRIMYARLDALLVAGGVGVIGS